MRRFARQGHLHRLRLLLLRVSVRRAAISFQRRLWPARQDGQMHILRRRPGSGRFESRIRKIRPQSPGRRQAPGLCGNVLDQGAAGRRWRCHCRYFPQSRHAARQGQRGMGVGHRLWQIGAPRRESATGGAEIMKKLAVILLAAACLSACGEKDQSLNAAYNKSDGKPWQGAHNEFMAKNWTPGDRAAWENQMRSRAQMQNEYAKVN